MQYITLLLLFITSCCALTTCTVGPFHDFATIQGALLGCNGGEGDIKLKVFAVNATIYAESLVFPADLTVVILEPLIFGSRINLIGAGHYVDPVLSWTNLTFVNVTFDGGGSSMAVFEPRITNSNVTLTRCFFVNWKGDYVIRAESCVESSKWTIDACQWADIHGNALELMAMESIIFVNNICRRCSAKASIAMGSIFYFHIHDISRGTFIKNFNSHWRIADEQPLRCRWYLDKDANTRCNQIGTNEFGDPIMELQCFDRITTIDADFCTKGTGTFNDILGNLTVQIFNDYIPFCRIYRECECNEVLFTQTFNGTVLEIARPMGNVFYNALFNPTDVRLNCTAVEPSSSPGSFICDNVFNAYGSRPFDIISCLNGWTNGVLADNGIINNTCVCPPEAARVRDPFDLRDPDLFPCRYSLEDGLLCNEEEPFCCVQPYWERSDSRYFANACFTSVSEFEAEYHFDYNFTSLTTKIMPSYNTTHYRVYAFGSDYSGSIAPVTYFFLNDSMGMFSLGSIGVVTVYAFNEPITTLGDFSTVTAILEGVSIFGVGTRIIFGIIQQYSYLLSVFGNVIVNAIPVSNSTSQCQLKAAKIALIDAEMVDPQDEFDTIMTLDHIPTGNEYRVEIVEDFNSTSTNRIQLYVNNVLTNETFGTTGSEVQLYYNFGMHVVTVLLDIVSGNRQVNISITIPVEEQAVEFNWQHDTFLIFDIFKYQVQFGAFFFADISTYTGIPHDVDTVIFRASSFFEQVFHVNCTSGVESSDCIILRDCEIGCDRNVSHCTVLNCTTWFANQSIAGVSLPNVESLDGCAVLTTDSGEIKYNAGWLFRDDSYNPAWMDLANSAAFNSTPNAGIPISFRPDPINRPMTECCTKLYKKCSCANLSPTSSSQNNTDVFWPNSTFLCKAFTLTPFCSCDNDILGIIFPPENDTVVYYIADLPTTLSIIQMIDNRAQQEYWGTYFQDAAHETLQPFSIALPKPTDDVTLLRIYYDNDNEFITGVNHDIVENPPPVAPRFPGDTLQIDCHRWCDNGCPMDLLLDESLFGCIVDKEATSDLFGFGTTIFENITAALERSKNGGCVGPGGDKNRTILVRFTEQFYDETLDIPDNAKNLYMGSFDGALVSGSNHLIDGNIKTLFIMGMDFVHALENKKALFSVRDAILDKFTARNCNFFGEQVRSGGLVEGRPIDEVVVKFCAFDSWELYAARFINVKRVTFYNNQIINSVGRSLFVEYDDWVQVVDNAFVETRGGADYKEAAFITLRAKSDESCQEWVADAEFTLLPEDQRKVCKLIKNRHHVTLWDEDQRDQCIWLDRGNWNAHRINRNTCIKAQYGITMSRVRGWQSFGSKTTSDIRGGTVELFSIYNPLFQPSIFRSVQSKDKFVGWDYRLRSSMPLEIGGNLFFRAINSDQLNFGDLGEQRVARDMEMDYRFEVDELWFDRVIQCEVNNNYHDDFMRFPEPPQYATEGFPNLYLMHGFHQFHNVSLAVLYCTDKGTLDGLDPMVFVTSWNGSRLRGDRVVLFRDIDLIGDTSDQSTWCTIDKSYMPVVEGHDHLFQSLFANITNMEFWLDEYEREEATYLWRSFNTPQKGLRLMNVTFDGRHQIPRGKGQIMQLFIGEIVDTPLDNAGNIKTNKPIPHSSGMASFYNVTIRNFIDFEGRVVDPDTGEVEIIDHYPYTDGIVIECVNIRNAHSVVLFQNCTFQDLDRHALTVENCLKVYGIENKFYNISGRSKGNTNAVIIAGNLLNETAGAALLYWANNVAYQKKKILFDTNSAAMNPQHVATYGFTTWPNNTTFCFLNNVANDLEVGFRLTASNRSIMLSCLNINETAFFPDRKRELRTLCIYANNSNVDGNFHDMIWDISGTQDRWRNNEWCDECCEFADSDICYVDITPELLVPQNSWYNKFLFGTISEAIMGCRASNYLIYVIGKQNIFGWYYDAPQDSYIGDPQFVENLTPFHQYYENIDAVVAPRVFTFVRFNASSNSTYNETKIDYSRPIVAGAAGHNICGNKHRVDLPYGIGIVFRALNFTHCGSAAATWHQPSSYNSTDLLIEGCVFNGNEELAQPFYGTYDNKFTLIDNELDNYTETFAGAVFAGRSCQDTSLFFISNRFEEFPGSALIVSNASTIVVKGNRFIRCGGQNSVVPYIAYVSVCDDSNPGMLLITDNRFVEHEQTVSPIVGKMAALWIQNVVFANKKIVIQRNCMDPTMDIAIRFENMPGSTRALLRSFALNPNDNICAQGSWHDLVEGPATNDDTIDSDPSGEKRHYCDNGCTSGNYTLLGYILGALAVALLIGAIIAVWFFCPNFWKGSGFTSNTVFSRFLQMEVPSNTHRWPNARNQQWHQPDAFFDNPQILPNTDTVAPELEYAQRATDRATGGTSSQWDFPLSLEGR